MSTPLKATQVAELLNCSVDTVYRMVDAGRLQGFYLMGVPEKRRRGKTGLRIIADSVDKFIKDAVAEAQAHLETTASSTVEDKPAVETTTPPNPRSSGRRAWEILRPPPKNQSPQGDL